MTIFIIYYMELVIVFFNYGLARITEIQNYNFVVLFGARDRLLNTENRIFYRAFIKYSGFFSKILK